MDGLVARKLGTSKESRELPNSDAQTARNAPAIVEVIRAPVDGSQSTHVASVLSRLDPGREARCRQVFDLPTEASAGGKRPTARISQTPRNESVRIGTNLHHAAS